MKKTLHDWMKQNPEKQGGSARKNAFEEYSEELTVLMQNGYSTKKIAQYLEDVEKVKFKKKDGQSVLTSLSNYLRGLAKEKGIQRRGRKS